MKRILLGGAAITLFALQAASAGPVSDFEASYRQMYGSYRAALFKTNSGDQQGSTGAMGQFASQLAALDAAYGDAPPPQYADDPLWGEAMSEAERLTAEAQAQIGAGDLASAHVTLEGVREVFGELHSRNGVETFSDRMNAYHAEMEAVLGLDMAVLDEAMIGTLHEQAAVLDYLARDLLGAPPAEAANNPDYTALSTAFEASVTALLDAVRADDPEQIRAAVAGLKVPYSKLFLKFG